MSSAHKIPNGKYDTIFYWNGQRLVVTGGDEADVRTRSADGAVANFIYIKDKGWVKYTLPLDGYQDMPPKESRGVMVTWGPKIDIVDAHNHIEAALIEQNGGVPFHLLNLAVDENGRITGQLKYLTEEKDTDNDKPQ